MSGFHHLPASWRPSSTAATWMRRPRRRCSGACVPWRRRARKRRACPLPVSFPTPAVSGCTATMLRAFLRALDLRLCWLLGAFQTPDAKTTILSLIPAMQTPLSSCQLHQSNRVVCRWLTLLLRRCSGQGQLPLVRSRLVEPLRLSDGKVDADLYAASAQLLIVALTSHPSLVDLLLFQSSLTDTEAEAAPPGTSGVMSPSNHRLFTMSRSAAHSPARKKRPQIYAS